jgi:hypothetical protein
MDKKSLGDELVEAVKARSIDRVRELLVAGADPNHWGGVLGETPLHYAAELGFEDVAEILLAAGADPDRQHFTVTPLVAATLAGKNGVARLIQKQSARGHAARTNELMGRLGWSFLKDDDVELMLSGTEPLHDRDQVDKLLSLSMVEAPIKTDFPCTTFEGWIKQIDTAQLQPLSHEALRAGFPWFFDLDMPPEQLLAYVARSAPGEPRRLKKRTRRFAGDELLPRSRYYTLSKDARGNDAGTLVCEMWAYSQISRTGKIALIDMADPTASDRLKQLGLDTPAEKTIQLVFLPGSDSGLSPFLLSKGLPQRTVAFPLPVKVIHERIDNVVDLRLPGTADWFARVVSQAVLEIYSPKSQSIRYLKCWPLRPPLQNFGQLLPTMLTQELGGGVLSVAAGALLRKAGVNGLVFPSARNDPLLIFRDGEIRRAEGWNFVDYRDASPPKQMVVLDVDRSWPDKVRLGPDFNLKNGPGPDLFKIVQVAYTEEGPRRGSFEVEGIVTVHNMLRQLELATFRNEETPRSWWM